MNGNLSIARRSGFAFLALTLLVFASGCYEKAVRGDASVYQFEGWVGITVILCGLIGVPIGILVRRVSFRLAVVLIGMGPLLILIIAPAMYLDKVVVDANHFETRYGFWFDPSRFNIAYEDLKEIRYVLVAKNDSDSYEMHCIRKNGTTDLVHAGDLVKQAVPEILERAKAKGVNVINNVPPE